MRQCNNMVVCYTLDLVGLMFAIVVYIMKEALFYIV